jgi:DNA-binding HxlR family transcriptional regulator
MSERKFVTFRDLKVTPHSAPVALPDNSSTLVSEQAQPAPQQQIIKELDNSSTRVLEYQSALVPESKYYRKPNEAADHIDRHLSPAESKVYEHLYRLIVGFNMRSRQLRVSTLKDRTGYKSMKTVRVALFGLESKGLIKKISRNNDPLGDEYMILDSGTRVLEDSSAQVENTLVLESKTTRQLNTILKNKDRDDELPQLFAIFEQLERELTGKSSKPLAWRELFELLTAELKIAAARTGQISSVPAFLTEHLRRRLWKKDKAQLERESKEVASESAPQVDASKCQDCGGSGWWYPEGPEKGVAKCRHAKVLP